MAILLNDNIQIEAGKHIDNKYGPYTSVSQAVASIPSFKRIRGLTVGILESGLLKEYWFKDGLTDADLIEKTTAGSGVIVSDTAPLSGLVWVNSTTLQLYSRIGKYWVEVAVPTSVGSGSGGGNTTPQLPNTSSIVSLWLDSESGTYSDSSGTTLATNNQTIARWNDKSGQSRHAVQSIVNNRPTLITGAQNNRNLVRFNGINNYIDVSNIPINQPFTVVAAYIFRDNGSYLFDKTDGNNRVAVGWNASGQLADAGRLFYYGGGSQLTQHSADSRNQKIITTTAFNGSSGFMRKNGSLIIQSTSTNDNGTTGLQSMRIGSIYHALSIFANMDLYELIVFGGVLSSQEIQSVENYLNQKWAIY